MVAVLDDLRHRQVDGHCHDGNAEGVHEDRRYQIEARHFRWRETEQFTGVSSLNRGLLGRYIPDNTHGVPVGQVGKVGCGDSHNYL